MNRFDTDTQLRQSPLENFLRDYIAARDGILDEVEPQVYDVLLGSDLLEVAFDPEALPEHPRAQLAALGSPLIDGLLSDAAARWNSAEFYRGGLHLSPHNLEARLRRAIALPPGAAMELQRVRAMHFPQAIFWFKATFSSDQREDEVLPVGIDLHYLREVRHLDALLAFDLLLGDPDSPLPDAPRQSLLAGYETASARAARSFAPLANARRREWSGAVEKQINRMRGYYGQLREEAASPAPRITDPFAAAARAEARREAIDREEGLRIAELRRKSALHVAVKLSSLLLIHQPKLQLSTAITPKGTPPQTLTVVWDPLSEAIEAIACPNCGQPTFALESDRRGLKCPSCMAV